MDIDERAIPIAAWDWDTEQTDKCLNKCNAWEMEERLRGAAYRMRLLQRRMQDYERHTGKSRTQKLWDIYTKEIRLHLGK